MSIMSLSRIKYLKSEADNEALSLSELVDIEEAFKQIPDKKLRDLRENATTYDMLDELEELVSPVEREIYNWVADNFGETEANDPSWDIGSLANNLESKFIFKEK